MNGSGRWMLWLVGALLGATLSLLGIVWNSVTWRQSVVEARVDNLWSDQRARGERLATVEARMSSTDNALTLTRGDFQRLERKIDAVDEKMDKYFQRGRR